MSGLRDGFSIELAVDSYEMQKDGTMKVLAGELTGVALVTEPAIRTARVSDVAASETENSETDTASEETNPTIKEERVEESTVKEAPVTETAEAPQEEVKASRPVAYTTPRSPIVDKVTYLQHSLRASVMRDEDSRQYVMSADNSTSTAPGMVPTFQSREVINALANADRGMIDALSRESLIASGMTFELPKVTAVPSVSNVD